MIPEKGELWISNGRETWVEKSDGKPIKTILEGEKNLKEMIITTSKNHRNEKLQNIIEKVGFKKVKIMGSIGCKIASILRGESDIYISLTLPGKSGPKDWDFSAPEAILKTAGGAITNLDNEKLSYGKSNFQHGGIIIATNNNLTHQKVCSEIKKIIIKYDLYPFEN